MLGVRVGFPNTSIFKTYIKESVRLGSFLFGGSKLFTFFGQKEILVFFNRIVTFLKKVYHFWRLIFLINFWFFFYKVMPYFLSETSSRYLILSHVYLIFPRYLGQSYMIRWITQYVHWYWLSNFQLGVCNVKWAYLRESIALKCWITYEFNNNLRILLLSALFSFYATFAFLVNFIQTFSIFIFFGEILYFLVTNHFCIQFSCSECQQAFLYV